MISFKGINLKRFAAFSVLTFICLYIGMFLLYVAWTAFLHPFFFIALQLFPPLLYLLFAWLYFRKELANRWLIRFLTAVVWIGLMLLLSAALMGPVYGGAWSDSLNLKVIQNQWLSVAAILVGGFVAHHTSVRVADSVDHLDFIPR